MRASSSDIDDGMAWYDNAKTLARTLSPNDVARGAGVIAALSPLQSWPVNVRNAATVFDTGTCKGLLRNVAKAERIYNGESPLDVLSGPKVRAFYLNIMGDHSPEAVTIDRHAIDVACGIVQSDVDRAKAIKGKAGYRLIADMYADAADIINKSGKNGETMTPAQLQAIVWVYWRRNVIANNHGDA